MYYYTSGFDFCKNKLKNKRNQIKKLEKFIKHEELINKKLNSNSTYFTDEAKKEQIYLRECIINIKKAMFNLTFDRRGWDKFKSYKIRVKGLKNAK